MHDGRKYAQQHVGMVAAERELSAHSKAFSTAVVRKDATLKWPRNDCFEVGCCQREIACDSESATKRQRKTSPVSSRTASETPSTDSQRWPETTA